MVHNTTTGTATSRPIYQAGYCMLAEVHRERNYKLMNSGVLKNMVVDVKEGIPMVHTRFKRKSNHYFGATDRDRCG